MKFLYAVVNGILRFTSFTEEEQFLNLVRDRLRETFEELALYFEKREKNKKYLTY